MRSLLFATVAWSLELTEGTWTSATKNKVVFVKFLAPW